MKTSLIENRQIRVFISSTFRDMHDERDHLMKRTFPKLRKLAAERDVTLTELDLRWGITEEESKSGKVVEICLREIENSIPFFIGIIGNRYGWVPSKENLGGNVTERFADVNKYIEQHLSVTEMEMQFGVLSREEDMHAYFYIKEQEENPEKVDYPEMLNRLKEEVRQSKYPSNTYNSPENLAMQVEEAFIALLDQLFPQTNLSQLEKERIGQRSFMNQLCQNYIKDEKNFEVLDKWLTDEDSRQFVVTGASGLGKSALIANWLKEKLTGNNCEYNIIYHFTGNGGSESSSEHITKSIANEIKDIYGWGDDELGSETKLEDLFIKVSHEGGKHLLIVIDAINQIVDANNAKLLNWLPIPTKGIKILFSTLEDDCTMEVFKNRDYPIFTLQPLDVNRRSLLVKSYLQLYAKTLSDKQVERIVTNAQCENTLLLKTLLDELINFGIYEKLDDRIEYYLKADTIDDFYQALLKSYEEDYKEYGDDYIKTILSIIAVSKEGLTEDEVLSIAKIDKAFPWSAFYCTFDDMFCVKNGRISFSHTYIRSAIEKRYMLSEPNNNYRYDVLLYYIPLLKEGDKKAFFEVPYQLYKINTEESIAQLYDYVKYPSTTSALYHFDEYLCREYWLLLHRKGYTFEGFAEFKDELIKNENFDQSQRMLFDLTTLLHSFEEFQISLSLRKEFLLNLESNPNTPVRVLAKTYNDVANECTSQGFLNEENFHAAFDYYNKAINLSKEHYLSELPVSFNGLALLCLKGNMYDAAIQLANMALKKNIERFGEVHTEVATNYNTLANAYAAVEKFEKSVKCYKKSISILTTLYGESNHLLIVAYYNLAETLNECYHYDEALRYINRSLVLIEKIYGNDFLGISSYLELKKMIENNI